MELAHKHEEVLQQMEKTLPGKEEQEEEGESLSAAGSVRKWVQGCSLSDFVGPEVDVHNLSAEELVTLQNNFNSLQVSTALPSHGTGL